MWTNEDGTWTKSLDDGTSLTLELSPCVLPDGVYFGISDAQNEYVAGVYIENPHELNERSFYHQRPLKIPTLCVEGADRESADSGVFYQQRRAVDDHCSHFYDLADLLKTQKSADEARLLESCLLNNCTRVSLFGVQTDSDQLDPRLRAWAIGVTLPRVDLWDGLIIIGVSRIG